MQTVQAVVQEAVAETQQLSTSKTLLCSSVTASTFQQALQDIQEIADAGADLIELRLDMLTDFNAEEHLKQLLSAAQTPKIVTLRPAWEGGHYKGPERERLAVLRQATSLGASHIDVELKAADAFFEGGKQLPKSTKLILSSHNFESTPSAEELQSTVQQMWNAGADIAKIATTATDITDCARLLSLYKAAKGPIIALCMGERGQPTRLLAAKYGGFLTFGAQGGGKESAPGQPTLHQLKHTYRLPQLTPNCQVFGVIGNPVAHSRSPQLHNAAMAAAGLDSVYLPLLVDNLQSFLDTFSDSAYGGFSVTIPHKLAALECAHEVDSVAQQIGAVNTLVRQPDNTLKGYNTDWSAAITAIEDGLNTTSTSNHPPDSQAEPSAVGDPVKEGTQIGTRSSDLPPESQSEPSTVGDPVNTNGQHEGHSASLYSETQSQPITAAQSDIQSPTTSTSQSEQAGASSSNGGHMGGPLGAEEATTSGRVFSGGQGHGQNESVLKGRTVVVIGAGGAGRALAFGAAHKGAKVIIANRSRDKAEALASQMAHGAEVVTPDQLNAGQVKGDVLANTTSIGMHPQQDVSPVAASALKDFELVFDAVYTPMDTQLLQDARRAGCKTVSGVEMFIGQAAEQFELFTNTPAPVELMRQVVLKSLGH